MRISPVEAGDGIAIGNLLAEAINNALGATLLPHALPFSFGIELLKNQLQQVGPLTLVCSNANYAPLFQESLLALQGSDSKVILDIDVASDVDSNALCLTRSELKLTLSEARELTGDIGEDHLKVLYQTSGGAYHTFLTSLCRLQGNPDPLTPTPMSAQVPTDREELVAPDALLNTLMQLKRYVEALDLAVMRFPERVPEVLKEAGPVYQDQGLIGRLYLLLRSLKVEDQENEEILAWLLVSSVSRGEHRELLPRVERFLAHNEAPHLRLRYAVTLPDTREQFAEAQRAAALESSPLALFHLGRLHPDPAQGVAILTKSVKIAEVYGRPYEVARNAGALAQRLLHTGAFRQASIWAEWAIRFFDEHELRDGDRRLRLLNVWAYSRLLIGEGVGLDAMLRVAQRALNQAELGLVDLFRSTLAELELSRGNLVAAEKLAADNLAHSPRRLLGIYTVTAVRVLLEKGDTKQALLEGQRAFELTTGESPDFALPATLALGMAQSYEDPKSSVHNLTRVMNAHELAYEYRAAAALYLLSPNNQKHSVVPDEHIEFLKTIPLGGLKVLSGPERIFSGVWEDLQGVKLPLRVEVLGQARVSLDAQLLDLPPRSLEILTLLAIHRDGLSLEQLHTALYEGEGASLDGLKVMVSKIRKHVPIGTQPYRLTTPFYLDINACESLLNEGRIRAALELYRGSVYPQSDAPGIVEARTWLEARVRQAALCSDDAEVLISVGEILDNDPEIWEMALKRLPRGDPRTPLLRARLEVLSGELGFYRVGHA